MHTQHQVNLNNNIVPDDKENNHNNSNNQLISDPLCNAINTGQVESAKSLIDSGAFNEAILAMAIAQGNVNNIAIELINKIKANYDNLKKMIFFHNKDNKDFSSLMLACKDGNFNLVKAILEPLEPKDREELILYQVQEPPRKHSQKRNAPNHKNTALLEAVLSNNVDIVKYLLNNIKDIKKKTAYIMHKAGEVSNHPAGDNYSNDVGYAIYYAVTKNNINILNMLLNELPEKNKKTSLTHPTSTGTPFRQAIMNKSLGILELLQGFLTEEELIEQIYLEADLIATYERREFFFKWLPKLDISILSKKTKFLPFINDLLTNQQTNEEKENIISLFNNPGIKGFLLDLNKELEINDDLKNIDIAKFVRIIKYLPNADGYLDILINSFEYQIDDIKQDNTTIFKGSFLSKIAMIFVEYNTFIKHDEIFVELIKELPLGVLFNGLFQAQNIKKGHRSYNLIKWLDKGVSFKSLKYKEISDLLSIIYNRFNEKQQQVFISMCIDSCTYNITSYIFNSYQNILATDLYRNSAQAFMLKLFDFKQLHHYFLPNCLNFIKIVLNQINQLPELDKNTFLSVTDTGNNSLGAILASIRDTIIASEQVLSTYHCFNEEQKRQFIYKYLEDYETNDLSYQLFDFQKENIFTGLFKNDADKFILKLFNFNKFIKFDKFNKFDINTHASTNFYINSHNKAVGYTKETIKNYLDLADKVLGNLSALSDLNEKENIFNALGQDNTSIGFNLANFYKIIKTVKPLEEKLIAIYHNFNDEQKRQFIYKLLEDRNYELVFQFFKNYKDNIFTSLFKDNAQKIMFKLFDLSQLSNQEFWKDINTYNIFISNTLEYFAKLPDEDKRKYFGIKGSNGEHIADNIISTSMLDNIFKIIEMLPKEFKPRYLAATAPAGQNLLMTLSCNQSAYQSFAHSAPNDENKSNYKKILYESYRDFFIYTKKYAEYLLNLSEEDTIKILTHTVIQYHTLAIYALYGTIDSFKFILGMIPENCIAKIFREYSEAPNNINTIEAILESAVDREEKLMFFLDYLEKKLAGKKLSANRIVKLLTNENNYSPILAKVCKENYAIAADKILSMLPKEHHAKYIIDGENDNSKPLSALINLGNVEKYKACFVILIKYLSQIPQEEYNNKINNTFIKLIMAKNSYVLFKLLDLLSLDALYKNIKNSLLYCALAFKKFECAEVILLQMAKLKPTQREEIILNCPEPRKYGAFHLVMDNNNIDLLSKFLSLIPVKLIPEPIKLIPELLKRKYLLDPSSIQINSLPWYLNEAKLINNSISNGIYNNKNNTLIKVFSYLTPEQKRETLQPEFGAYLALAAMNDNKDLYDLIYTAIPKEEHYKYYSLKTIRFNELLGTLASLRFNNRATKLLFNLYFESGCSENLTPEWIVSIKADNAIKKQLLFALKIDHLIECFNSEDLIANYLPETNLEPGIKSLDDSNHKETDKAKELNAKKQFKLLNSFTPKEIIDALPRIYNKSAKTLPTRFEDLIKYLNRICKDDKESLEAIKQCLEPLNSTYENALIRFKDLMEIELGIWAAQYGCISAMPYTLDFVMDSVKYEEYKKFYDENKIYQYETYFKALSSMDPINQQKAIQLIIRHFDSSEKVIRGIRELSKISPAEIKHPLEKILVEYKAFRALKLFPEALKLESGLDMESKTNALKRKLKKQSNELIQLSTDAVAKDMLIKALTEQLDDIKSLNSNADTNDPKKIRLNPTIDADEKNDVVNNKRPRNDNKPVKIKPGKRIKFKANHEFNNDDNNNSNSNSNSNNDNYNEESEIISDSINEVINADVALLNSINNGNFSTLLSSNSNNPQINNNRHKRSINNIGDYKSEADEKAINTEDSGDEELQKVLELSFFSSKKNKSNNNRNDNNNNTGGDDIDMFPQEIDNRKPNINMTNNTTGSDYTSRYKYFNNKNNSRNNNNTNSNSTNSNSTNSNNI